MNLRSRSHSRPHQMTAFVGLMPIKASSEEEGIDCCCREEQQSKNFRWRRETHGVMRLQTAARAHEQFEQRDHSKRQQQRACFHAAHALRS